MDVNYYGADEDGNVTMQTTEMSGATGLMTAYNRIGATYAGASAAINTILRAECGFTGTILSDAGGEPNTYMTTDYSLRKGQNLTLTNNGTNGLYDTESPTAIYWLKNSTRYLLYNKANSNAVMGMAPGAIVTYGTPPRVMIMWGFWALAGLFILFNLFRVFQYATGKKTAKVKEGKAKDDEDDDEY